MSSGSGDASRRCRVLTLSVCEEPPEDLVGEPSRQGPNGFGLGDALLHAVLEAVTSESSPELGHRNAVQGGIDLSVATPVEPVADVVGRPHRDRRGAVVTGKGGLGAETGHIGSLTQDLGRGERPAAVEGQEVPGQRTDSFGHGALELVDAPGVGLDAGHELGGQGSDQLVPAGELGARTVQDAEPVEGPGGDVTPEPEFVEMPAQAVLVPGPLGHQVLPVVQEQPEEPLLVVEAGHGKLVLSEGGSGHSQGVDRVGLAPIAPRAPGQPHEPGWHPHDVLPGSEEVGFQASGQVPTALDGPGPLLELLAEAKGAPMQATPWWAATL